MFYYHFEGLGKLYLCRKNHAGSIVDTKDHIDHTIPAIGFFILTFDSVVFNRVRAQHISLYIL